MFVAQDLFKLITETKKFPHTKQPTTFLLLFLITALIVDWFFPGQHQSFFFCVATTQRGKREEQQKKRIKKKKKKTDTVPDSLTTVQGVRGLIQTFCDDNSDVERNDFELIRQLSTAIRQTVEVVQKYQQ